MRGRACRSASEMPLALEPGRRPTHARVRRIARPPSRSVPVNSALASMTTTFSRLGPSRAGARPAGQRRSKEVADTAEQVPICASRQSARWHTAAGRCWHQFASHATARPAPRSRSDGSEALLVRHVPTASWERKRWRASCPDAAHQWWCCAHVAQTDALLDRHQLGEAHLVQ